MVMMFSQALLQGNDGGEDVCASICSCSDSSDIDGGDVGTEIDSCYSV